MHKRDTFKKDSFFLVKEEIIFKGRHVEPMFHSFLVENIEIVYLILIFLVRKHQILEELDVVWEEIDPN